MAILMIVSFNIITAAQDSGAGQTVQVDGSYLPEELEGFDKSEAESIRKILQM